MSGVCDFVWGICVCMYPRSKRKKTSAIDTKLGVHVRHGISASRTVMSVVIQFPFLSNKTVSFFGQVALSHFGQDHHPANSSSLRPPCGWRRPRGRPRTTWLKGIDADVLSAGIGIQIVNQLSWRPIIDTATLH